MFSGTYCRSEACDLAAAVAGPQLGWDSFRWQTVEYSSLANAAPLFTTIKSSLN